MTLENWKYIPGYDGIYEVSNTGRVRRNGAVLKSTEHKHRSGTRLRVSLSVKSYKYVHRLVMLAFVGPCPEGKEVCHRNGNPIDNRLENLYYGTRKENEEDKLRHGKRCMGDTHGRRKLTSSDVVKIRSLCETGNFIDKEVAAMFNVTRENIKQIRNRKSWTHII